MSDITVRELSRDTKAVIERAKAGEVLIIKGTGLVLKSLVADAPGAGSSTHAPASAAAPPNLLSTPTPARPVPAPSHARYDTPAARDLLRKLSGGVDRKTR